VNGTDSMTRDSAACGKLTDDIVVNEDLLKDNGRFDGQKTEIIPWTPMKEFAGKFDGNRKKISGLFFKDSADAIGLFGSITGGSERNLLLSRISALLTPTSRGTHPSAALSVRQQQLTFPC
jgi:hypothetical protein